MSPPIQVDIPFSKIYVGYNGVKEFVNVIEEQFCDFLDIFERMMGDAETLLYDEFSKSIKLFVALKLYNIKAQNGWYNKSFTNLLTLLKDMLPIVTTRNL